MSVDYIEPEVTFAVLDFLKPDETRLCLESIRRHVKVPHRVHYLHNGPTEYAYKFYEDGLVDLFIQTKVNAGLGVGTRDLISTVFTPYFVMMQNDQIVGRDLFAREFTFLCSMLTMGATIQSISLAGCVGGRGVYSERAHIMQTAFYRQIEHELPLSPGGAGPYHHQIWREEQIQNLYRDRGWTHMTEWPPLVQDNGVWTIRDTAGGGRVKMRTDTKAVWWLKTPTERGAFPEHTDAEWNVALEGQWPGGQIPQLYTDRNQSFNCWGNHLQ